MRHENTITAIAGLGGTVIAVSAQQLITFALGAILIIVSIISNLNANKKHNAERKLAEEQLKKLKENEKV